MRLLNKYGLILSILLVYVVTAYNSTGYYHPDEHYQIIEFAGLKSGWNKGDDLTWEYDARIRPALQPMIASVCFYLLEKAGIGSPFDKTLFLRLLTAGLVLCSIYCFARIMQREVKPLNRKLFWGLSFFLWFLPAVNVRFSSETWAGLCLILAIAWSCKQGTRSLRACAGTGLLMGLSFEFRFQMAFCIIGLLLWLLLVRKWNIKQLSLLIVAGFSVVVGGIALDSWFYGEPVVAFYNYFESNILQDMASNFGISPWYYYFIQVTESATTLLGLAIWISLLVFLLYFRYHILSWCLIPFLIVHFLVPHKELRFLFPLINLVPFLLVMGFQLLTDYLTSPFIRKALINPVFGVIVLVNILGLVIMMNKPAGNGNVGMAAYIDDKYGYENINLYAYPNNSPYSVGTYKGLTARFYLNGRVRILDFSKSEIRNQCNHPAYAEDKDLVVLPANDEFARAMVERWQFKEERRSMPAWVSFMNRFYKIYDDRRILVLYTKKNNLDRQTVD